MTKTIFGGVDLLNNFDKHYCLFTDILLNYVLFRLTMKNVIGEAFSLFVSLPKMQRLVEIPHGLARQ